VFPFPSHLPLLPESIYVATMPFGETCTNTSSAITTTTTIKNRWAARSLGDKGPFGNYGGRIGNSRCKTFLPKWPKLKDFQDDEIERACRCHVGQWWQAPVVTKTVYH
jgi:hypothetical protein